MPPGLNRRGAAIIPLGSGSLRNSSSLPEGRGGALLRTCRVRAGPALPSYLALLHAGFSVPRMLPSGRWALTPPFHPCPMCLTERGVSLVLPKTCRRGASDTGGLFSVALSVAAPPQQAFARRVTQPPGVTRRVALPWPALASSPRLESGLSSRPLFLRKAGRRSPGSPANCHYNSVRAMARRFVPLLCQHIFEVEFMSSAQGHGMPCPCNPPSDHARNRTRKDLSQREARSFSKPASSRMGTPSDLAFSCFEPGSAPTTT